MSGTPRWTALTRTQKDIPISKFTYKHPSIQLEVKAVNGTYQATLNKDVTEMSGTWKQGTPLPLVLKRTTEPDVIRAPMAENEYTPRQNSDLQGYWKGTLKVNDKLSLRVALKIAEHADGTFRVDGDSIDQGARNLPASGRHLPFTSGENRVRRDRRCLRGPGQHQ